MHNFYDVLMEVIPNCNIESSSDLIVTLGAIVDKTGTVKGLEGIQILAALESTNYFEDAMDNVEYIRTALFGIIPEDVIDIILAYQEFHQFFLHDFGMNKLFPMDVNDHVGWKIHAELCDKMSYSTK